MSYLRLLCAERKDLERELALLEADLSTELPSYVLDEVETKIAQIANKIRKIDKELKFDHSADGKGD